PGGSERRAEDGTAEAAVALEGDRGVGGQRSHAVDPQTLTPTCSQPAFTAAASSPSAPKRRTALRTVERAKATKLLPGRSFGSCSVSYQIWPARSQAWPPRAVATM